MRTETINIYKFNELSDSAKDKAVERFHTINVNHDWWDSTYEDAARIGLKLESFNLDRNRHATGVFTLAANEVAANIFIGHGDVCDTYKLASEFMEAWQPIFDAYTDESSESYESSECEEQLMELENEFLKAMLEEYSIMLQKESEYLTSEEAIIETIEANEYDFTEDGKLN